MAEGSISFFVTLHVLRAAGRYCGHCCRCFKALSDPVFLEYDTGPECNGKSVRDLPGPWISGGQNAASTVHAEVEGQSRCTEGLS
jgi:hypothetical protein